MSVHQSQLTTIIWQLGCHNLWYPNQLLQIVLCNQLSVCNHLSWMPWRSSGLFYSIEWNVLAPALFCHSTSSTGSFPRMILYSSWKQYMRKGFHHQASVPVPQLSKRLCALKPSIVRYMRDIFLCQRRFLLGKPSMARWSLWGNLGWEIYVLLVHVWVAQSNSWSIKPLAWCIAHPCGSSCLLVTSGWSRVGSSRASTCSVGGRIA